MVLNEIGQLAHLYWMDIPNHFSFIELGNFVVMPNHVHWILIINKITTPMGDGAIGIETPTNKSEHMANISPKRGCISTIIRSYKSAVTKNARFIQTDFAWQPRFHDHIIRNDTEFAEITNYIGNNPKNWNNDNLFKT